MTIFELHGHIKVENTKEEVHEPNLRREGEIRCPIRVAIPCLVLA